MRVQRTAVRVGTGVIVGGATLVFSAGVALADQGGGNGVNGDHVTICHATGSTSNPYVVMAPSAAGVLNGHYDHQDDRDIIPPFSLRGQSYPGHDWSSGQSVYDNGCKVPTAPGAPGSTPGGSKPGGGRTGGGTMKVTICHATGSKTNPFVVISPAAEGVIHGHYAHQDQRDIIPPFTFDGRSYAGQNWTSEGKAISDAGCTTSQEPGTPGTPGTTDTPGTPDTPDTPDTPGTPATPGTPGTPDTPGTPGTSGGSTVVTAAGATTPVATAGTTSTGVTSSPVNSAASTYEAPSASVHAGEFDSGISAAQWAGIALSGTVLAGAGAGFARRRLGRVRA